MSTSIVAPGVPRAPQLEHPVHWVASDQRLAELCADWQQLDMVAVDTEFMRSVTYYPQPALVQINDGCGNYLIDPLAISDFSPLTDLLLNPAVVKVLHSCSEDLEVFQTLLKVIPQNIFDTQVAAAFAGYGFSTGYANLVQQVLQVELPKGETRSDWLQRPLSQAQLLYAAIDVEYLLVVARKLRAQLEEMNRLLWVEEDAARVAAALTTSQDADGFYLRIKSAWRLNSQELAILKDLARWREEVAQRRNVPRNRVVKEHVLLSLAQHKPEHVGQLRKYEGMTERVIRADGEAIIQIIRDTLTSDPATWPAPLPKPLSAGATALMKTLKAKIVALAEQLDLAPEILLRKKDYEVLVRAARSGQTIVLPENLRGWRQPIIGDLLLQVLTTAEPAPETQGNASAADGLGDTGDGNSDGDDDNEL